MTTAYAQRTPRAQMPDTQCSHFRIVSSAPGQGREANKVLEKVCAMNLGTPWGQSVESNAVTAAVRDLVASIAAREGLRDIDDRSYDHVPLTPISKVKVTYKFFGKMTPRQFPEVE